MWKEAKIVSFLAFFLFAGFTQEKKKAEQDVPPAVDRFAENMSISATQTVYFLPQPNASLRHQVLVTLTPQFVAMSEGTGHTSAHRLSTVFSYGFGVRRRQLAVPVDGFGFFGINTEFCARYRRGPDCHANCLLTARA